MLWVQYSTMYRGVFTGDGVVDPPLPFFFMVFCTPRKYLFIDEYFYNAENKYVCIEV